MPYQVGQMVTVLPPYDDDPLIVSLQHYGRVAERVYGDYGQRLYYVVLGATWPADEVYGPYGPERLLEGWRDPVDGVWWIRT